MIKKFLIPICLLLICGCATYAKGPLFSQAPESDKCTLYIYRGSFWGATLSPRVFINNKLVAKLDMQGYTYVYLSPGIYRISFEYSNGGGDFITEFEVKENQKEIYMKYYGAESSSGVVTIPELQALSELKNYRYIEANNKNI